MVDKIYKYLKKNTTFKGDRKDGVIVSVRRFTFYVGTLIIMCLSGNLFGEFIISRNKLNEGEIEKVEEYNKLANEYNEKLELIIGLKKDIQLIEDNIKNYSE